MFNYDSDLRKGKTYIYIYISSIYTEDFSYFVKEYEHVMVPVWFFIITLWKWLTFIKPQKIYSLIRPEKNWLTIVLKRWLNIYGAYKYIYIFTDKHNSYINLYMLYILTFVFFPKRQCIYSVYTVYIAVCTRRTVKYFRVYWQNMLWNI